MNEQRRLAAIVSADVAGYSRLMGATRAIGSHFNMAAIDAFAPVLELLDGG